MRTVLDSFALQSKSCAALGSAFMGRLMHLCATRLEPTNAVANTVLNWSGDPSPQAGNVSLRLAGALHALIIDGTDPELAKVYPPNTVSDDQLWAEVLRAMSVHEARLLAWLQNAPQTNEVRRAAAIAPVLHMIAAATGNPLQLLELGASGGLNLRSDFFAVRTGSTLFGPTDSPVQLSPDWSGPAPQTANLRVTRRAGVDLNPLDPGNAEDRLRLRAYLWPDQPDRRALTDAAIKIALETAATIYRGDAIDWLEQALIPTPGHTRVVFHTVAWQYFPKALQDRGTILLQNAARAAPHDSPLAHLSMEWDGGDGAALCLSLSPHTAHQELARVDFHGRWIRWTGPVQL